MNNSKQQLHTVTGVISSLQSSLAPPPQSVLMAKPAPTSCTLLPSVVTQGFIVCWGYGLRKRGPMKRLWIRSVKEIKEVIEQAIKVAEKYSRETERTDT
ncbi:hypothetical protein BASA83_012461 [Batrachochytrium salamandrivorans]|nr:hypothetical protein BASA83_012461 [Batrachochytrium salamandrivorans]